MSARLQIVVGIVLAIAASAVAGSTSAPSSSPSIAWQSWSDDQFAQAKREHRFVLLDLEAVWCHWCHVMDDTTYADPEVRKLISEKYIPVRVDQDSRPDISNRYEDYGWPATVVFDGEGHEIVKRRGYLPPAVMASMLQAIIDDPTPGPSVRPEVQVRPASSAGLTQTQRGDLMQRLGSDYDAKNGGWFGEQKYIDPNVIEYCLIDGDSALRKMACQTLDDNTKLIDPVWGGVDQYSTNSNWEHPHFEKIMSTQAGNLRVYAQAYLATGERKYLDSAEQIHGYLKNFLISPEGAFYVSQDADLHDRPSPGEPSVAYFKLDDAARRKLGVPRVDQHIYSRENGWAIQSLCELYAATGDHSILLEAIGAADWILKNRAIEGGGFRHDAVDSAGPYLGDTLEMGRAFLSLYESSADRVWLGRSEDCAAFIRAKFGLGLNGLPTAMEKLARPEVDENVDAVRFFNLLYAYTRNDGDRAVADNVMRYLAAPEIWQRRGWAVGGILLADREMGPPALHLTIVGRKSDPKAAALFAAALRAATAYKRVDWYDPSEGKLPDTDVRYPVLPTAAAFVCTGNTCSSPITTVEALEERLKKVAAEN